MIGLLWARIRKWIMTIRILVVDDHPAAREGLKILLHQKSEWEVVGEAADGLEALDKAASTHPDVVLLDVTMPKVHGLEVCRLLRLNAAAPEILIVSQHDSPHMMREALDVGARGYVVKSNAGRDLLEAIDAVSKHRVFLPRVKRDNVTSP
jgi:DNA-binding NarL/FixJ family response regulator